MRGFNKGGVLLYGAHAPRVDSPERKAKKQALYGGDYRRRAQAVKNSATHCHICNKAFEWGDTIEADHLIAGNPDGPLAPAHRICNQRRGNTPLT
jgi:hypothetical protein